VGSTVAGRFHPTGDQALDLIENLRHVHGVVAPRRRR
jgi:hypothetical protein